MSARRHLTVTERLSVVVIVVGVGLLAIRVVSHDDPPTGPLYSVAQIQAAMAAAGIPHHANPADQVVDLWVVTFDRGASAAKEQAERKAQAEQNQWLTVVHGNVYAEIEAPATTLPSDLVAKIPAAINGLAQPADHVPPVLKC